MSKDLFMTNEELVEQIQNGFNVQENMGILYEQNEVFIRRIVKPYTAYADIDDLMQEAYIGLHDAVEKFDSSKGFLFLTYAPYQIKNRCINFINHSRDNIVPTYMISRISKYKKLVAEHNGSVNGEMVKKELGLTTHQYKELIKTMHQMSTISIDVTMKTDSDDTMTIGELIPDDGVDIETDAIENDCKMRLWNIVDSILDDKQKDIVIRYYINQESLIDMAMKMGCSRQNISVIKRKAESILKNITEIQELAEFWGYDSMMAYSGKNSVEDIVIRRIEYEEKEHKMMDMLEKTFRKLYEERKIENGDTESERQIQVSTD